MKHLSSGKADKRRWNADQLFCQIVSIGMHMGVYRAGSFNQNVNRVSLLIIRAPSKLSASQNSWLTYFWTLKEEWYQQRYRPNTGGMMCNLLAYQRETWPCAQKTKPQEIVWVSGRKHGNTEETRCIVQISLKCKDRKVESKRWK